MKFNLYLIFVVLLIGIVSAGMQVGDDRDTDSGVSIVPEEVVNVSSYVVNSSDFWNTAEGVLDDVSDIQMSWITDDNGFYINHTSEIFKLYSTGEQNVSFYNGTFENDVSVGGEIILENGESFDNSVDTAINANTAIFRIKNTAGTASLGLQNDQDGALVFTKLSGDSSNLDTIYYADKNFNYFRNSADGETKYVRVYGYPTGEDLDYLQIQAISGAMQITTDDGEIYFDDENLIVDGNITAYNGTFIEDVFIGDDSA